MPECKEVPCMYVKILGSFMVLLLGVAAYATTTLAGIRDEIANSSIANAVAREQMITVRDDVKELEALKSEVSAMRGELKVVTSTMRSILYHLGKLDNNDSKP